MNQDNTWRYILLGVLVSMMPLVIVLQLVRIQTNPKQVQALLDQADLYAGEWKTVMPARGYIYDRWGALLAGNRIVYQVGADLKSVENPHTIALTLNLVLGSDYQSVFNAASIKPSKDAVYAVLADNVPKEKIEQLELMIEQINNTYAGREGEDAPSMQGVLYYPHLARTYPEKTVASNLLGFVNLEGVGFFGVEEKFNDLLAGKPRTIWVPRDPNRVQEMPVVPDGASLVLTIDLAIQSSMEELVDQTVDETGAESVTIVVTDPRTGEILAMATNPRLDLNEYWDYGKVFTAETPFNRAVSQAYEPGSVFKVLTVAAGLDSGVIRPETTFIDQGVYEIGGVVIRNWDRGAWGPQDMTGCLQHSLNVCMAWIAVQTGAGSFYDYMRDFGIGHLSGVELAGESAGRLKQPGDSDWYEADLGTNSFGQGVATTPLQMAAAAGALANDGKLMTPHIVRSILNKGYQHDMEQHVASMPVKPEIARTLSEMLAQSLEIESSNALVTGYRVAGKTGTAEIPTAYGYIDYVTNASFIGWGPVDDPRFVVYVWLEKPTVDTWSSRIAAPVFREAVERLVVLMKLPPDDVRRKLYGHNPGPGQ